MGHGPVRHRRSRFGPAIGPTWRAPSTVPATILIDMFYIITALSAVVSALSARSMLQKGGEGRRIATLDNCLGSSCRRAGFRRPY